MAGVDMLPAAWQRCFRDIGGSEPPSCVWEELLARYGEPQRAHHTQIAGRERTCSSRAKHSSR